MKNKERLKLNRMEDEYLEKVAGCLKIMAHPVRLRIVEILSQGRFAVGQIAERCGVAPNQTCEHLRMLQNHGLLESKREGRTVYYSITSEQLKSLFQCISNNCPVKK